MTAPHHTSKGFRNPWPGGEPAGFAGVVKWMLGERTPRAEREGRDGRACAPPMVAPSFPVPRAPRDVLTATWVGHSTFLLQLGGWNVLTDPMWSERASPVAWAGPRRYAPPGVAFDALPPIDLVLLSHDHYDHLDDATVRRIAARWPAARWAVPLRLARWLRARGVRADVVTELDWWETATVGPLSVACVPAQHFSGRGPADRDRSLWCGWAVRAIDAAHAVLFAGDTGLHPAFGEIARRHGPFALALLPIGAYAPRWFMRPVHCDPDDALAAYDALCAGARHAPVFGASHWGAFALADEPCDEPPRRTRDAWARSGRDASRLWIPSLGETRRID
ncbi:Zn-dependent hydrolase [Gemmatirosa kalamazoonensis]|uniref:Zn-dependent hydrolase n=1 Tax=Gemmatirosa kalamazoonensis TaxID=861299 RepID=W0RC69_9BACT|nr:MBL fold metallo-hydrolase [Gemmatirosa kalamazoonensis]AHG88047.1 Zn-dependent hydrolase [Gemmatirosa kalamazoonensis]